MPEGLDKIFAIMSEYDGEPLSSEGIAAYGYDLGRRLAFKKTRASRDEGLERELSVLSAARARACGGESVLEQWICDSYRMLENLAGECRRDGRLSRKAPSVWSGGERRLRARIVAHEYVVKTHGVFSDESFAIYIEKVTEALRLTMSELDMMQRLIAMECVSLCALISRCYLIGPEFTTENPKYLTLFTNAAATARNLPAQDFSDLFERISRVERILRKDGVYVEMTAESREYYRRSVARLAKATSVSEEDIALRAVEMCEFAAGKASHVGYYICGEGKSEFVKSLFAELPFKVKKYLFIEKYRFYIYFLSISVASIAINSVLTFLIGLMSADFWWTMVCGFFSYIPVYFLCQQSVNRLSAKLVKPAHVPKLDMELNRKCETMVVIPLLAACLDDVRAKLRELETYYYANESPYIHMALLCDFPEGGCELEEAGSEASAGLEREIASLNERYGRRVFYYFARRRVKTPDGYMGWERKRGALLELGGLLLKGDREPFMGNADYPKNIKYLLTLDADTQLTRESVKRLVGAMEHPLNEPELNDEGTAVRSGYALMQPRIITDVESANKSGFARLFSGQAGLDIYSSAVSNVYADLFGEGIFTGKGMFNLSVYYSLLNGAFPERRILSHDLIEGAYLRCALVTDVVLYDGFPASFVSWAKRAHRWIRGDFQLIGFMFMRVKNERGDKVKNPINTLSRYKISDNFTRAFYEPCSFILIALSFTALKDAWCLTALTALIPYLYEPASRFIAQIYVVIKGVNVGTTLRDLWWEFHSAVKIAVFRLCSLPFEAYNTADAIFRALYRQFISKKKLLEWTTSDQCDKSQKGALTYVYRYMAACPVSAALFLAAGIFISPFNGAAFVFAALFALGPYIAHALSKPVQNKEQTLSARQKEVLGAVMKRTWEFFAEFTDKEHNYLTPDNFQEYPFKGATRRTSVTNAGFTLAAAVVACARGYIKPGEMLKRLGGAVDALERMEKKDGLFYNWYDAVALTPFEPRYVSTVDLGNLACYMIVACEGIKHLQGPGLKAEGDKLCERIMNMFNAMDFGKLYDAKRNVFCVGMDESGRLSPNHYDLLASEARQTSYIAIAKGDVPQKNWFSLKRPMVKLNGLRALLSWSGSCFEYFMPEIICPSYPYTLLKECERAVAGEQIRRARSKGIPFGISESGYFAFDAERNYQYKAFSLPSLCMKPNPSDEEVVSPYSTFLIMLCDLNEAFKNMLALRKLGAFGKYGFYEAVDYTRGKPKIVKSYMAHHQGMILCALSNILDDGLVSRLFLSSPIARSALPLLKEKVLPKNTLLRNPDKAQDKKPESVERRMGAVEGAYPRVTVLGNENMSVVIDQYGGGFTKLKDVLVNKKSLDYRREQSGLRVFLSARGKTWAAGCLPGDKPDSYECVFVDDTARFKRTQNGLYSETAVFVDPSSSQQIIITEVKNTTDGPERVKIFAVYEPALCTEREYQAHPAFADTFISAEANPGINAVVVTKRDRATGDKRFAMLRILNAENVFLMDDIFKIFRPGSPAPDLEAEGAKGRAGAVCGCVAQIAAGESVRVAFALCASQSPETISESLKLSYIEQADHLHRLCASSYLTELTRLKLRPGQINAFELLAAAVIYRLPQKKEATGGCGDFKTLWKYAISGDYPLAVIIIDDVKDIYSAAFALKAREYLAGHAVEFDLALVIGDGVDYGFEPMKGVFPLRRRDLGEDLGTLESFAHVVLYAGEEWKKQLEFEAAGSKPLKSGVMSLEMEEKPEPGQLKLYNGFGGFNSDGDYEIALHGHAATPAPWSNILANKRFGTLTTSGGGGYAWAQNARLMRLTPFRNDAMRDIPGEGLMVFDEASGRVIDLLSSADGVGVNITMSAGEAVYKKQGGLKSCVAVYVPREESAKIYDVEITNNTDEKRRVALNYYAEPALGEKPGYVSGEYIVTRVNGGTVAVRNPLYCGGALYVACDKKMEAGDDRDAYFALGDCYAGASRELLSRQRGQKIIAVRVWETLKPGQAASFRICLGYCAQFKDVAKTAGRVLSNRALREKNANYWKEYLSTIQVKTPSYSFNLMMNKWFLYGTAAARLMARTGYYQSGGATGFRDQLQDAMSSVYADAGILKAQILIAAARQFIEGDVLHWWHEPNTGVRTKISDDRLFLPLAACRYAEVTGDLSIFRERVPYLVPVPIPEGGDDLYASFGVSDTSETLLEHCVRAIERSMEFGPHGLSLIGGGDWNDAMNRVGNGGSGESVWLSMFLCHVLERFANVCKLLGEDERAARYRAAREVIAKSIDEHGYDEAWYIRAYFDDGTPIGSEMSEECKIDLISQAFSVISGIGSEERRLCAYESAKARLIDYEAGAVRLLDPPFDKWDKDPGYIKSYKAGVRENGAQYTHGAAWFIIASCMLGKAEDAFSIFDMINPATHAQSKAGALKYAGEPYATPADILTAHGLKGRAGWTWYTGSSSWLYMAGLEHILGFKKSGGSVAITPCIPKEWDGFTIKYKYGSSEYVFNVRQGKSVEIKLEDDGKTHEV